MQLGDKVEKGAFRTVKIMQNIPMILKNDSCYQGKIRE
jgi:hypothetical protein